LALVKQQGTHSRLMKPPFSLWVAVVLLFVCDNWLNPLAAQTPSQAKWTETGNLSTARTCQTATLLPDGRVLIVGGHGYSEDLASAELYNPNEGIFIQTPDLSPGRAYHTATLLPNGQVLVVGGQSNGTTLASAELYNPVTRIWTHTGSLHGPRAYHTATLLSNGQVLVVGGTRLASPPVYSQGAPPGGALDTAELYDSASGKWTSTQKLHTARYTHTATLLPNGQVLVAGGLSVKGSGDALASAELYNPATKTWTTTGNLSNTLFYHTATLLPNGQVLVVGERSHETLFANVELYNPASGTWTPTGSLHAAHSGHTATLLPSGQVLIAGGATNSGVFTAAELYNPSAGTWEMTASLNTARLLHTATLLPNGQVLAVGGSNGNGSPSGVLASAELYNLATETVQKPVLDEVIHPSLAPSIPATSSLITLAGCLVVFTVCVVILTSCAMVLLCAWLVYFLIRRGRK